MSLLVLLVLTVAQRVMLLVVVVVMQWVTILLVVAVIQRATMTFSSGAWSPTALLCDEILQNSLESLKQPSTIGVLGVTRKRRARLSMHPYPQSPHRYACTYICVCSCNDECLYLMLSLSMLHTQLGTAGHSVIPNLTIGMAEHDLLRYFRDTLGVDFRTYESTLTTGAVSSSVSSLCMHVCMSALLTGLRC
jgi:hypothetical protein